MCALRAHWYTLPQVKDWVKEVTIAHMPANPDNLTLSEANALIKREVGSLSLWLGLLGIGPRLSLRVRANAKTRVSGGMTVLAV